MNGTCVTTRFHAFFVDVAIACLLRKPVIIQKCTLSVEEIDLNEVYRPYLIVHGLPPFMSEQTEFLKLHFETLSNTKIQSIKVEGTDAFIRFVDPRGKYNPRLAIYLTATASMVSTVTHDVALMDLEILASKLWLEVCHEIENLALEEQILTISISGLPPGMSSQIIQTSVKHYLMKAEIKTKSCDIVNDIAYVTLEDPSSECIVQMEFMMCNL